MDDRRARPVLQQAVRARVDAGPIDVKAIIAQMLQMGDEGHNRNRAGSLMLLRELLPALITADAPSTDVAEAVRFSGANEHFFLNLGMPACKLATVAARGDPGLDRRDRRWRATAPTSASACRAPATQWFTGPANTPEGLFLGRYGPEDANPDIGDSAITETGGIGGFAMAAAPGDRPLRRRRRAVRAAGDPDDVRDHDGRAPGLPGADPRVPRDADRHRRRRGGRAPASCPQINTGMAGRVAGTGQVGAGLVTPPVECFPAALAALAAAVPA